MLRCKRDNQQRQAIRNDNNKKKLIGNMNLKKERKKSKRKNKILTNEHSIKSLDIHLFLSDWIQ